jgi:hypothetical protein
MESIRKRAIEIREIEGAERPTWVGIVYTGSVLPWAVFTAYDLDAEEWATGVHCATTTRAIEVMDQKIASLSA